MIEGMALNERWTHQLFTFSVSKRVFSPPIHIDGWLTRAAHPGLVDTLRDHAVLYHALLLRLLKTSI